MPEVHMRRLDATISAVHTTDDDWTQVLSGWLITNGADEAEVPTIVDSFAKAVNQEKHRPWLLSTTQGIAMAPPELIARDYEDVAATDVLDDIYAERQTHPDRGYGWAHDDVHSLSHFTSEVSHRMQSMESTLYPTDAEKRRELVQAASILVAAIDKIDRAQKVRTTKA